MTTGIQFSTIHGLAVEPEMERNTVSFRQHFQKLKDFNGRESRSSFWPYAAAVLAIFGALATVPPLLMMRQAQEYGAMHPEKVTIEQSPGHYSIAVHGDDFAPDQRLQFLIIAVTFALAIAFSAAAVARRLRDSGVSPSWGILPLPFIVFSTFAMPFVSNSRAAVNAGASGLSRALVLSNLLYLISIIILAVLLARRSATVR